MSTTRLPDELFEEFLQLLNSSDKKGGQKRGQIYLIK